MRALAALALWVALAISPVFAPAFAQVADPSPVQFRDAAEETRFRALAAELRCVMCQNQSLADSDAPIAHDLRRQVLDLMREGKSDAQIKDYLVVRYSEFVLYAPPVKPATWALWFGPGVVVALGVVALVLIVRRKGRNLPAERVDATDIDRPDIPGPGSDEEW